MTCPVVGQLFQDVVVEPDPALVREECSQHVLPDADGQVVARLTVPRHLEHPEAVLARELAVCYAAIGLVTLCYQITASILQPLVGLYADKRPTPLATRRTRVSC